MSKTSDHVSENVHRFQQQLVYQLKKPKELKCKLIIKLLNFKVQGGPEPTTRFREPAILLLFKRSA